MNENFQGKKVYDPSILTSYNYDYVIIASMYEHEILHQLTEQGINSDKIILPGNYTNSKYFLGNPSFCFSPFHAFLLQFC